MSARRALASLLILLAALARGGEARAHATLVFAHPADGAVVAAAPATIRLRFNEPVTPLLVRLLDSSGRAREDAVVRVSGDTIEITPPAGLGGGALTLSYRIVSADGHPVGGSLAFSIGAPGGGGAVEAPDFARPVAIWSVRAIYYLAFLFGAAGAFAAPGAADARTRRCLAALLTTAALASILSVGLQGLDLLDAGWAALLDAGAWRAGALSPPGASALLALCALGAFALSVRGWRSRLCALAGLVATGASFAASGHASVANPQLLTRPAVFLHAAAATILLGPLLAAAAAFPRPGAALRRLALPALAALVASGLALAIVQVEAPRALVETAYGRLLLAKLAALAAMFGAVLLARRTRGRPGPGPARLAQAQLALACVVLLVTAGWRLTPPPRALATVARTLHVHAEKMMAMLTFDPGRAGANRVQIEILDGDFGPLEPKEVRLVLTPANAAIEPVSRPARRAPGGGWSVDNLHVPFPGAWTVTVEALVTDFDRIAISEGFEFTR